MVQFNETSLTITVGTVGDPIEFWQALKSDLIRLLQTTDRQVSRCESFYYALDLLGSLTPDYNTAIKMTNQPINNL